MSRVYSIIFDSDLPRVLEEMKISLQPNPKSRVGYWMLFIQSIVIWVYGYQEGPYLLPIFLTPRIFSLEFIRQRIISEVEHFLKAHKASNLKFPFIVGPFVVKNKSIFLRSNPNSVNLGSHSCKGGNMILIRSYQREHWQADMVPMNMSMLKDSISWLI
jgi:hypothetical protein